MTTASAWAPVPDDHLGDARLFGVDHGQIVEDIRVLPGETEPSAPTRRSVAGLAIDDAAVAAQEESQAAQLAV